MKKIIMWVVIGTALLVAIFYALNSYIYNEEQVPVATSHMNATYRIDGANVQLKDGVAVMEAAPDSAENITTRYFGNDLITDLDNDGREDIVFLVTQEMGGSGTFFYAVGALNTERGYVASEGYPLGDRIAPQTTEISPNERHKNVVVVNYADRALGETMTTAPSVGKSVYLKLDPVSMMWGIVEPDFEGESR